MLSEQLNYALSNLDESNFVSSSPLHSVISGTLTDGAKKEISDGYSTLKTLIIKTADTVRSEMDEITTELSSKYVAQSDFGAYSETINTRLSSTASDATMALDYYAELSDSLNSVSDEFNGYTSETQGYIKQGIVGYNGAVPVIGIAIGQDITTTGVTETVNGKQYDVIDTRKNMSVWTTEKLSFYINGAETAYFSNGKLNVLNIEVTGAITIGGKWEISHSGGFGISWIGD